MSYDWLVIETRQSKATTPRDNYSFLKRKRRAASGGIRTHNVLRTRQTLHMTLRAGEVMHWHKTCTGICIYIHGFQEVVVIEEVSNNAHVLCYSCRGVNHISNTIFYKTCPSFCSAYLNKTIILSVHAYYSQFLPRGGRARRLIESRAP